MSKPRKYSEVRKSRFAKEVLAGKTFKQAAVDAGYKASRSEETGSELAKTPEVKAILEKALDKAGVTVEKTARVVAKALDATKWVGEEESAHEVDDHPTQLKAVELSWRARRILGTDGAVGTTNVQINFVDLLAQQAQQRGMEWHGPDKAT